VDRGNCSFVQKVRNCEYAGASAVIVVDNIDECEYRWLAPSLLGSERFHAFWVVVLVFVTLLQTTCPSWLTMAPVGTPRLSSLFTPNTLSLHPGRSIQVPSVLVHKFDGQKIKTAILTNLVQLSLTWSLPEPDGRVEASFWTSSENDEVCLRLHACSLRS
jgi:hypothetical protein